MTSYFGPIMSGWFLSFLFLSYCLWKKKIFILGFKINNVTTLLKFLWCLGFLLGGTVYASTVYVKMKVKDQIDSPDCVVDWLTPLTGMIMIFCHFGMTYYRFVKRRTLGSWGVLIICHVSQMLFIGLQAAFITHIRTDDACLPHKDALLPVIVLSSLSIVWLLLVMLVRTHAHIMRCSYLIPCWHAT